MSVQIHSLQKLTLIDYRAFYMQVHSRETALQDYKRDVQLTHV